MSGAFVAFAPFGAILHVVPDLFPFLAPGKGLATGGAGFAGQVGFADHFGHGAEMGHGVTRSRQACSRGYMLSYIA